MMEEKCSQDMLTLDQINDQIAKLVEAKNKILADEEERKKTAKAGAFKALGVLVDQLKQNLRDAQLLCDEYSLHFSLDDTSLADEYGFGGLAYYGKGAIIADLDVLRYGQDYETSDGEWRSSSYRGC